MSSNLVIIVGASGTGKSTLQSNMEKYGGYKRIVTYTTRPPREGEIDGVSYNFVTENYFEEMIRSDVLAEYTSYNTTFAGLVYYGSKRDDYMSNEDSVIVLNPDGVMSVLDTTKINPIVVYLQTINDDLIFKRLEKRGDKYEEINRRISADKEDFGRLDKYLNDACTGSNFTVIRKEIMGLDEMSLFYQIQEVLNDISNKG